MNTNFAHTLALYDMRRGLWISDDELVEAFTADGVDDVLIERFTDCLSDTPMTKSHLLTTLNEFLDENNFPVLVDDVDLSSNDLDNLHWSVVRR
jgi:hypothetical protein